MYKYRDPNTRARKDLEIVFLEVVEKPFWYNYNIESKAKNFADTKLNVGDITWAYKSYIKLLNDNNNIFLEFDSKEQSLHPEDNRWMVNFSSYCFKVLHTTIQKLKK